METPPNQDQFQFRLPFYQPIDKTAAKIWPGYTLIIPVSAVGNVGQLTCDLLISTLLDRRECQFVGRIYSPALMAVVGPNPFSLNGPATTSTEVYVSNKWKLVIIQQRTSQYKEIWNLYAQDLVDWIKQSKFDQVFVLTSSFGECNPDLSRLEQYRIMNDSIYTITTSSFDHNKEQWKKLNLKPVKDKNDSLFVEDGMSFMPGSGITKLLMKILEKSSIPAAFIVSFCSEGINTAECYEVAHVIDRYVGLSHISSESSQDQAADSKSGRQTIWREPLYWSSVEMEEPNYY